MAQPLVKKDDDRDDEAEYSPFMGIEKGAVLQEARVFNDPQLDARRCSQVITKLLYLLNQGETFTKTEATEVFFAVTKLFQSKDMGLRRMVYLMIKEISPSADEVIIVTSSLMKDMNSKIDMYRANAIRVLCRITDGTLLAQIERYLKQAIVDKNPIVASAALVSGIHLLQTNPEIVKRWSNEVQESVQSRAAFVQFHALGLLHQIRQNDRLAVSKLVSSLTRGAVRSPLAQCLLIRYTSQVIRESGNNTQSGDRPFYDFLESCLRHKSEMVIFEAARAITELNGVTSRELNPAITVLQLFLSSSKPVLRFAAVRTLNKVAMIHPTSVTNCNIDMESLISDQNRSIATLAITTLLKTGNESSVDRLMKQITNFMSDIADEFKIVVVEAIRSLCQKFPLKYRSLMNFLSNILREEGGFEYKKAIVDSIVILIREIPDAKETGLLHLCEFIEDCEFTYLSTQILHFLGIEGPKTSDPSKYIRFIYNRVHLENATVRAGAVSTLAKFGAAVDELKPRIFVLLRRCLFDSDDEVRDRATLYLNTLGGDGSVVETDKAVKDFLFGPFDIPLVNLETSLKNYEPSEEAFDIDSVPKEVKSQPLAEKKASGKKPTGLGAPPSGPPSTADAYQRALSSIPEFANFGNLFKSSAPVELTEAETEYAVNVVKHIFDRHVVFQYNCTNTIPEQLLEHVIVIVDNSEADEFSEAFSKPLKSLPYDSPGQIFVAFEKPEGVPTLGKFSNVLKFIVREVDPTTGEAEDDGVEDEYQLEDLEIVSADYTLKVGVSNFRNAWESMGPDFERVDEYGLGPRESLAEAVNTVINLLGLQPCEGTEVAAIEKMGMVVRRVSQVLGLTNSNKIRNFSFKSLDLPPLPSPSLSHGIHVFHCPDTVGIVAKLSECIASRGGNILAADVFVPQNKHVFYSRSDFVFDPVKWPRKQMEEDFLKLSQAFNATRSVVRVPALDPKYKIAVLASKQDHCLVDLLHGWQDGKLPVDITCVISNHHRDSNTHVIRFLERHGIPYHCLSTTNENKREGEILELVQNTDFLVLARYMQILSGNFIRSYGNDIINIHHGLLPSFKGGHPSKQAFEAGVKLIGATSHFVSEELDSGPIIEQMVERVSHRDDLQSFVQKSENLEKQCLSKAIRSYCELRVLPYEIKKTVVF